jgi:methyl-accepting chemotaxis protein WspA
MRTTIAAKLYLSFGLMAALIAGSAAFILHTTNESRDNYEDLYNNTRGAVLLASAQNALWELRFGLAQFVALTPEHRPTILAAAPKWHKQVDDALEAYGNLNITAEEKQLLGVLRDNYRKYVEARPRWFELYSAGKFEEAAEYRAKTTTFFGAATVTSFSDLIVLQQKVSIATQETTAVFSRTTRRLVFIFSALSLTIAGLVAYFATRSIVRPLAQMVAITEGVSRGDFTRRMKLDREDEFGILAAGFDRMINELTLLVQQVQRSGIQVNTSVNEIAATAKQQQATANEVAATTTEISATSREIAATSKELVKTVGEVTAVAEQTATLANSGQTGLTKMEETMQQVMAAGASINAKLSVLNEKAGNINQVVTTITKVADQTNLLSLNAAIEAEKAGEYGRGFAVVATEIRRLADQTAVATSDIEQMVKEMQSAVSAGVMGMDKFSEEVRRGVNEVQQVSGQLGQIIQQVQTLTPRFEVVNEGMQAQATGAEQISDALAQLGDAARQTAEAQRQSTQAIEQLNGASQGLKVSVEKFKLS